MNYPALFPLVRHLRRHSCLLLVTAALLPQIRAQNAPGPAAPAKEEEAVTLPAFTVSGQKGDPYAPGDAMSTGRTRAALTDTAASVSVITSEFMKDIGAQSILDATRYSAGMSAGRGGGVDGISDRHVIRGFESIDGRVVDSFQTGFQANFDPAFIERIEVVKGPNSILTPTGAPGGTINVISKSPSFIQENSLTAYAGRFDAQKISLDSTGPLPWGGNKLAYLVIANDQDTDSFLPGKVKNKDVEAALTWKITPSSQLTVKYFGIDWTQQGAVSAANSWGVALDPNLPAGATMYNRSPAALGFDYRDEGGVTDWSTRKVRVNMFTAEYTMALGDRVSMRLAGNWLNSKFGQDQGLPSIPNIASNRYNPSTGDVTPNYTWAKDGTGTYVPTYSLLWDPTAIKRTATFIQSVSQTLQIQQDFAGNFNLGSATMQPVIGWSDKSDVNFPNSTKSVALPTENLFAPDDNIAKPALSTYTKSNYSSGHNSQLQAYIYDRLGMFNDRLFVTGGAARIWLDNVSTNLTTHVVSPLKGYHDTYMGGVLFKPLTYLSVYYSYSSNAAGTSFNNLPLWRSGKQHEFGFKTDFFNKRLSFTAAHYQIVQTNLTTPNPAYNVDPINNPLSLLSNQSNHGLEFELKGGLTKNLSIVASYSTQKLRDTFGRRPRNIPDKDAALLLNYHFTDGEFKGLNTFIGATYQGNTAGETPASSATALGVIEKVGFYLPEFTVVNAGVGYSWNRQSINLTIDNVLNHHGYWQSAGRGAIPPIPLINPRISYTYRF